MKLRFGRGYLPHNHHIRWKRALGDRYDYDSAQKRSCVDLVELGKEWEIVKGRTLFGWRLWIYGGRGQCWNFDVYLIFDACPFKPPSRYAPRPSSDVTAV